MSNTLKRVLASVVGAPLLLWLAYLGGWPFAAGIAGIGLLGQRELYRMAEHTGTRPHRAGGYALGALVVASLLWPALWPVAALALLLFLATAAFLLPQAGFFASFSLTITGVLYPTGLLGSLVWLREARSAMVDDAVAFQLVGLTLLLVWAADVSAYAAGRAWGRHALAQTISPNKTWEGALGGVCAAALMGAGLKLAWIDVLAWRDTLVIVLIAGGVGPLGDLLESVIKRSTDTNDSSTLIPGHGGVLDRFDAMALVAPLVVLYLDHIMHVL